MDLAFTILSLVKHDSQTVEKCQKIYNRVSNDMSTINFALKMKSYELDDKLGNLIRDVEDKYKCPTDMSTDLKEKRGILKYNSGKELSPEDQKSLLVSMSISVLSYLSTTRHDDYLYIMSNTAAFMHMVAQNISVRYELEYLRLYDYEKFQRLKRANANEGVGNGRPSEWYD